MNYKDVALLDQSFGNLQDSILRSRMMDQQKQERGQEQAFRERELSDREQRQAYERDPSNPQNRQRTAQASIYEDQAKKLGITQVESEWTTQDGQSMRVKGTLDEVKKAAAAAPAKPGTKITSNFTTKDGVSHRIEGTPEALKAQQDALSQAGGGIQDSGTQIQEVKDSDGNTSLILRNPRNGSIHTIKAPQAWETETTEFDELGRPTRQVRRPVKPNAPGQAAPTAPRDTSKRRVGTNYTLPDGKVYTWRGKGWEPIE